MFLDYSGTKYTRFPPKIAAAQKALFRVVENGKHLNRLRNGHLEKSVATGICRVQRSPKTAKTPAKVHLRLRFQNPGKPRTAGLSGRAAGACDCGPLSVLKSNGLRHPKNLPVKFGFSSKSVPANIAKKLPPQCCSKPLLIPFFNFSHKRPTFAFAGKSEYTLGFAQRIAHNGSHAEIGAFRMGGWYHYPRSVPHVRKPPRAGCQNGKFCRFWVLAGGTPKERREPAGQRCAYARRCPEASLPRWAAQSCCCPFSVFGRFGKT